MLEALVAGARCAVIYRYHGEVAVIQRIGARGHFLAVAVAITVRIGLRRIGAGPLLFEVGQAIAVSIGIVGIGAVGLLGIVTDAVTVGVGGLGRVVRKSVDGIDNTVAVAIGQ